MNYSRKGKIVITVEPLADLYDRPTAVYEVFEHEEHLNTMIWFNRDEWKRLSTTISNAIRLLLERRQRHAEGVTDDYEYSGIPGWETPPHAQAGDQGE